MPLGTTKRLQAATLACALLGWAAPAAALDPQVPLQDYHHAMWTGKDGAPAQIFAMAQTPDGWLWLGTPSGLYRYDGVRFELYPLPKIERPLKSRIYKLHARPNGDLWIADGVSALAVLRRDGALENVAPADHSLGAVQSLAFDTDGSVWVTSNSGLHHLVRGTWRTMDERDGWPPAVAAEVTVDQYGRLWALSKKGVHLFNRASGKFDNTGIAYGEGRLIESPDGRLWLAEPDYVQLIAIPPAGAALPRPAHFNPAQSGRALFDRDGNLWALACPKGVCLLAGAAAGTKQATRLLPASHSTDKLDQKGQLSSLGVNAMLEDREGNIWIATQSGLDRFRENKVVSAHLPEASGNYTMARDTEGQVWAVDGRTMTTWRLAPGKEPVVERGQRFMTVANDRDGALLLAGPREIQRRFHGKIEKIALPPGRDGKPVDLYVLGLIDDGKVLWMASPETGLMGRVGGKWQPRSAFNLPPHIFLSTPAQPGQLWNAVELDKMVFYDNGKQTSFGSAGVGLASVIKTSPEVIVGGDQGLAVLQGKQFRRLAAADPAVLVNVTGVAVSPGGDRWLNGSKGIVHVTKAAWSKAMAAPGTPLEYELIGALEGYPGQAMIDNRRPSIFTGPDGRLWFMGTNGIVSLHPERQTRNTVAPAVELGKVRTGAVSYPALPGLRLPPDTRGFSIDFTAPSLRQPEGVRFQYQLEGVDSGWQAAGSRRAAYYTNVAPGAYRFRVKAANEDGVMSAGDATLSLEVLPTFAQTVWFKIACALALAALLYLLYRQRLRAAARRGAERMRVRMAERERIARTLHDSFLQSVYGIILRFDAVARELPADHGARKKLELVLDSANATVNEGRDQVYELRSGRSDDVEAVAQETGRQLMQAYPGIRFHLEVSGAKLPLQPKVAEELCEIVREALRNAFQHAGASNINVGLAYGSERFTLLVADDGKGMPTAPQGPARQQRWGLVGMRERSARIGAALEIDGARGAGTRVSLGLPGRRAYANRSRGRMLLRRLGA